MIQLNVKYAHLEDTKLIDNVLLADRNPLAVELAKRFKVCVNGPPEEVEELQTKVAELEKELSEINDV